MIGTTDDLFRFCGRRPSARRLPRASSREEVSERGEELRREAFVEQQPHRGGTDTARFVVSLGIVALLNEGFDNVNTNDIHFTCQISMRIESFEWDSADDEDGNTAHISQHGVSPEEVEEALTSNPLVLRGPDGRYLGYGKSADGGWIFVPFVKKGKGIVRAITARPMTDGEKRLYRKKRGK